MRNALLRNLTTASNRTSKNRSFFLSLQSRRYFVAGTNSLNSPGKPVEITSKHADPAMKDYAYWNREDYAASKKAGRYNYLIQISPESVVRDARILSLSDPKDEANVSLQDNLPFGAAVLATGSSASDFDFLVDEGKSDTPNVLFVSPSCPKARKHLPRVLKKFPSIEWVHVRSAGIDFIVSDVLSNFYLECENGSRKITYTNAKGQFSSSLAEYTMMACSYFAKDLPRLMKQKERKDWIKYDVEELRGKTMGIVGYGDIGRACAKLAHVYGMKIIALRRNPKLSEIDPLCEDVYGTDKESLECLMSESDYIVCSAPSTMDTHGLVGPDAFASVKENAVFINLGRGPVIDEDALIASLKDGRLKGAALDVFQEEPLPRNSELWNLENVLLSPHNMDQTSTFMHEAAEFFVFENLPRFMCGKKLLNHVDPLSGY